MSKPLTIVTFCWRGWRGDNYYNSYHVNALAEMVRQNCSIPHRFVCVTDDPKGIRCETVPLWGGPKIELPAKRPNCFKRLALFHRDLLPVFGPKVLQLDLDSILLDDIAPLITDDPFKIMHGKAAPYNGSMWQVTPGWCDTVWSSLSSRSAVELEKFNMRSQIPNYGSDQAWMSYKIPGAPTWNGSDGCYHFTLLYPGANSPGYRAGSRSPTAPLPQNARAVFFAGGIKPWTPDLAKHAPLLFEAYQKYMRVNFDTR